MADIIVRRLDEKVKERLKARAEKHGRSLEAETRAVLEAATEPEQGGARPREPGFGTLMRQRFSRTGLTPKEARLFERAQEELWSRDAWPIPDFEE